MLLWGGYLQAALCLLLQGLWAPCQECGAGPQLFGVQAVQPQPQPFPLPSPSAGSASADNIVVSIMN